MLKRFQGTIIGIIIGATLFGGVAFAEQTFKTGELYYNNIKIYIDGAEIVPKDVTGKVVEPFAMNGTTYLPVRAISNALGKEVEWDGETQSVYIGKKDQTKPDNYLDRIQYADFVKGSSCCQICRIIGTVDDFIGNTYTNGILIKLRNSYYADKIEEDADDAHIRVDYPLNSLYSTLSGKIVLTKDTSVVGFTGGRNNSEATVDVFFYGDGKLLKKINDVIPTMPVDFNLNIRGVNMLTIKTREVGYGDYNYIALTDLALYK